MDVVKDYFPTVIRVIPLNNFHVQVFFDDGKVVEYDATRDLKADIFASLRDIKKFKNACTVMNGTLAWDISGKSDPFVCIDIDPFTLYELNKNGDVISSKEYNDKKSQEIMIGDIVKVTVDRPRGTSHPKYKDMFYPVNYGYIKGIIASDGEEQDAYILGVDEPVSEFTGTVIAIVHRRDDVEDKWVVGPEGACYTKEQIMKKIAFTEQYFDSEIIM